MEHHLLLVVSWRRHTHCGYPDLNVHFSFPQMTNVLRAETYTIILHPNESKDAKKPMNKSISEVVCRCNWSMAQWPDDDDKTKMTNKMIRLSVRIQKKNTTKEKKTHHD